MWRALTAIRRWMNECHCKPAIGKANRHNTTVNTSATTLPYGRTSGTAPASATASAHRPTNRHIGAGVIRVAQRTVAYSASAENGASLMIDRCDSDSSLGALAARGGDGATAPRGLSGCAPALTPAR